MGITQFSNVGTPQVGKTSPCSRHIIVDLEWTTHGGCNNLVDKGDNFRKWSQEAPKFKHEKLFKKSKIK
jgi:hypothetical protein